jgi:Ca2+-transporting ATPase
MAIGQLLLTYPSRHTATRPLANPYLHAAVVLGMAVQVAAAMLPWTASLLGNARLPIELWVLVFGGAVLAWAFAEAISRLVWRRHVRHDVRL